MSQEKGIQPEIIVEKDWRHAFRALKEKIGSTDLDVVIGKLYLISDVRPKLLYGKDTSDKRIWN